MEPNGKDWRFFLRRGVQFHNGFGEFTARDFVAWFEAVTKRVAAAGPSAPPVAADMRANVEGIDIINDYEFVFRYKSPARWCCTTWVLNARHRHFQQGRSGLARWQAADDTRRQAVGGHRPVAVRRAPAGTVLALRAGPVPAWRVGEADFPELELRWMPENSTRLAAVRRRGPRRGAYARDEP